jgi:hypothetical protein
MAKLFCPKCEAKLDSEYLKVLKCPDCRVWLQSFASLEQDLEVSDSTETVDQEWDRLDPNTRAIVEASNRSTHAVRSLSIFFFTWMKMNIFSGVLVGIGLSLTPFQGTAIFYSERTVVFGFILILAGGLVSFIGFFVALARGMRELELSKP